MDNAPITSETAFYRYRLGQERNALRQRSVIVMILCSTLLGLGILLGGFLLLARIFPSDMLLFFSLVLLGVLGSIFLVFGVVGYRLAKQPVSEQEVLQLRQSERIRLFREAQGVLPVAYRPWRLALDGLLGMLCSACGIACLLFSFPGNGVIKFLYAGCLQCTALSMLYNALYVKPRRARLIPSQSARELKQRLALGEIMCEEGAHDTNEAT